MAARHVRGRPSASLGDICIPGLIHRRRAKAINNSWLLEGPCLASPVLINCHCLDRCLEQLSPRCSCQRATWRVQTGESRPERPISHKTRNTAPEARSLRCRAGYLKHTVATEALEVAARQGTAGTAGTAYIALLAGNGQTKGGVILDHSGLPVPSPRQCKTGLIIAVWAEQAVGKRCTRRGKGSVLRDSLPAALEQVGDCAKQTSSRRQQIACTVHRVECAVVLLCMRPCTI